MSNPTGDALAEYARMTATQPSELLKRLDTIMQGRVNATLRYKREDYAEMVKIVTLDLPDALRAVVPAPRAPGDDLAGRIANAGAVLLSTSRGSFSIPEQEALSEAEHDRIVASLSALPAQAAPSREREALRKALESISQAESMVSAHIEEYHDFDYPAHAVPTELQALRGIQHHLLGSMLDKNGRNIMEALASEGNAGNAPNEALKDLYRNYLGIKENGLRPVMTSAEPVSEEAIAKALRDLWAFHRGSSPEEETTQLKASARAIVALIKGGA